MNYVDHDPHGIRAFSFVVVCIVALCVACAYVGIPWYSPFLVIAGFAALSLLLTW